MINNIQNNVQNQNGTNLQKLGQAFNAAASLATSDYLCLIDDDNYLLPDWDFYLFEEIEKIGHPYFALSATKIEN